MQLPLVTSNNADQSVFLIRDRIVQPLTLVKLTNIWDIVWYLPIHMLQSTLDFEC
jgi:hypothetical protein